MRAGYGLSNLTPPLGIELAGYGYYLQRRATHMLDPLRARALLLEDEQGLFLLVSCDVLGLSRAIVETVEQAMHAHYGLTRDRMMIVSIHTHTGPALKYHEGCGEVDALYADTVAPRIIDACDTAWRDLAPVESVHLCGAPLAAPFAYNRAHAANPVDDTVRGFIFRRVARAPIALVSYACHAVSRGRIPAISADYPGQVNALLTARGYCSLYVNGVCGDIDPLIPQGEAREARLDAFAQAICDAFLARSAPCRPEVWAGRVPFTLRLTPTTAQDIRAAAAQAVAHSGGEGAGAARVARAWERDMLARVEHLPTEETVSIACVRIGGAREGVWLTALPFEAFTHTGQLIRRHAPGALVLGCAEELLGYLPTRDDIDRGAYAALESTFLYKRLPAQAGEAERLGTALGTALRAK